MTTKNKLIWAAMTLGLWVALFPDIGHCEEHEDVALWLARSCVGEASWGSAETGECAAILHIYAKRARKLNWTFLKTVKRYSAAVKRRKDHPRPWVLNLNRRGTKPSRWNDKLIWDRYRARWFEILDVADNFLGGIIADPLPVADHYGGPLDVPKGGMTWIRTPEFRNRFYTVKK